MAKVFLITGSSRGLGRSIAEAVLAAGHQLVATARRPEQLDDLVAQYGDQVRAVKLDVTDYAAAQGAVQVAVEAFGRLDVVVNNAGYANFVSVEDIPIDDFREQIETNLLGVVNVTKAALPTLREQGSGYFIQVSSVGGRSVAPGLSAYQAAKWAVGGFSGVLAREVNPLGIKVTVLEPGGMSTDWAGSSMKVYPISRPYEQSLGALRDAMASGLTASDPAKVAQVVLQLVELDEVPQKLLLGSDAVTVAAAFEQARAASDAQWIALSRSTDHDNVAPEMLDPLGHL
ncbi:SDR family NAD(P)-dependent oxidoreductase [Kribbella sp. NPDC051620]|uniref:SDR family NAD(P)-dependent oxidoreductase n=1 Tax=Kribbella sp. NPDC051620 TaxID=3364120 RepID=UPI003789586A